MRVLGGFNTPGAPGNLGALLAQAQPGFTPAPGFQDFEQSGPGGFAPPVMSPEQVQQMEHMRKKQRDQEVLNQRNQERSAAVNAPIGYEQPGRPPVMLNVNAVPGAIESLGGSAVLQLDPNQKLKFGGSYMPGYSEQGVPVPSAYRVEAEYSTPSLGVNVNYRPTRQGSPLGGGFGGDLRFNTRF